MEKKTKHKKVENACEQRWWCLLLEGFFGHAYFHLSRGERGAGVFEVEEGAGAIDGCCTAIRGQPKRERDGVDWEGGGGAQQLAFT